MAERRPRSGSGVRPKDRPTRGKSRRSAHSSSTRQSSSTRRSSSTRQPARRTPGGRGTSSGRGTSGRPSARRGSVLNPGFPRWAVVALVLVLVFLGGGWVVFSSSWFGVREVRVEGTAVLQDAEVRAVVGLSQDDALATVDTAAVAVRVKKLAPVAGVEVRRSWPGTLVVRITERQPVATVQAGGRPWVIDIHGVLYAPAEQVGKQADNLLPLEVDDPSPSSLATREAVKVIAGLDETTTEMLDSVTAESAAQVTLVLDDGRQVVWGDSSRMNDKITMLPAVLEHAGSVYDISSPTAIVIK